MIKHAQTIRRQQPTNCLNMFDHFVKLALKVLTKKNITLMKMLNNNVPKIDILDTLVSTLALYPLNSL